MGETSLWQVRSWKETKRVTEREQKIIYSDTIPSFFRSLSTLWYVCVYVRTWHGSITIIYYHDDGDVEKKAAKWAWENMLFFSTSKYELNQHCAKAQHETWKGTRNNAYSGKTNISHPQINNLPTRAVAINLIPSGVATQTGVSGKPIQLLLLHATKRSRSWIRLRHS